MESRPERGRYLGCRDIKKAQQAVSQLQSEGLKQVDPGYTATDFNNHSGHGTVSDAAARVVKAATLSPDGPTGQFFSDDNAPETGISPW